MKKLRHCQPVYEAQHFNGAAFKGSCGDMTVQDDTTRHDTILYDME